jgi:hypothetical protein
MDTSAHRMDHVEMDRVERRLDNRRNALLPDEVCSISQTQSPDQVRPDIIHEAAFDSFMDGAGI